MGDRRFAVARTPDADVLRFIARLNFGRSLSLGGVDKFEPISGGGEMDHSEEAVGQLIVSGGDGAIDLELSEHAFDAIALLVERPIMLDLHATV